MYITPRTLLGIIRTAQAHAKCRFTDVVEQEDIDEAIRLIETCRDTFNESKDKDKSKFYSSQKIFLEMIEVLSK